MLLYFLATFCILSVTGYSVLDEEYLVLQSDSEELQWPSNYTVKARRVSLTSNIVEDFTAWKTALQSRVDYNQGAVKVITKLRTRYTHSYRYEIHPETTEEELNKIVCHNSLDSVWEAVELDDILPPISEDEPYETVGNETIDGIEAVKFEYNEKDHEKEVRRTVWAYYEDGVGWIPVRQDYKKYNIQLGSLKKHEIWTYYNFELEFSKYVFNHNRLGCDEYNTVKHTADSEKITKELLFINPEKEKHVDHVFTHFKNKFQRKYPHEYEHAWRKTVFRENMRMISSVNRRNLGYKLGVNQFSDWTPEELESSHGAIPRPEGMVDTVPFPYEKSDLNDIISDLPKEYDMRVHGLVSPVKNQESCGSCWTFAASAVTESALAKVNGGRVLALSNQAIIDCAYEYLGDGHGGCHGGFDFAAYDFIMKHGLPTEQEYGPYKMRDGYCTIGNMTKTYPITGYTKVTRCSNNAMKVAVVNHGALFIYIRASPQFQAYSSGIFYEPEESCNPNRPNHAVTLIGYGEQDGEEFWILKNSWGESWGVDGYMLISARDNVCGVASKPSYPVF